MKVKTKKQSRRAPENPVDDMVQRMIFSATDDTNVDPRLLQVASLCLAAFMFEKLIEHGNTAAPDEVVEFSEQLTDMAAQSKRILLKSLGHTDSQQGQEAR